MGYMGGSESMFVWYRGGVCVCVYVRVHGCVVPRMWKYNNQFKLT